MPRVVTLGDLATRVRYQADLVNNQFVTDTMLFQFLSDSAAKLWNKLVRADPERYMREQTPIPDANGEFDVAADYFGTIAIDWSESSNSGIWINVPRVYSVEANQFDHDNSANSIPCAWHPIYGTTVLGAIRLLPPPDSTYIIRHKYTVQPPVYTASTDTVDGIAGWEEYVVIDSAITCRIREESSTAALDRKLALYEAELDSQIDMRNAAEAGRVVDTRSRNNLWDPSVYNWYSRRG